MSRTGFRVTARTPLHSRITCRTGSSFVDFAPLFSFRSFKWTGRRCWPPTGVWPRRASLDDPAFVTANSNWRRNTGNCPTWQPHAGKNRVSLVSLPHHWRDKERGAVSGFISGASGWSLLRHPSGGAGGCDDEVTGSDSRTGCINTASLSESEAAASITLDSWLLLCPYLFKWPQSFHKVSCRLEWKQTKRRNQRRKGCFPAT